MEIISPAQKPKTKPETISSKGTGRGSGGISVLTRTRSMIAIADKSP